ncbi:MAG: nucleoside recognition protein [Desulfobulbus sp.]|jgi:hypothetical protein|nr:nucleoside recognition protein [Desulfobulbus sp.]
MFSLLRDSLCSALDSALLILKFVVPFYLLADILAHFDLLRHLGFLFAPLTNLLDLPAGAAVALAGGVLINIYAAIAFAAPLDLSPYQWTVLGVFLGVCHSMPLESAIMRRIGLSWTYSLLLRGFGACLAVTPVLFLPASFFATVSPLPAAAGPVAEPTFWVMLLQSLGGALGLSAKIILLITVIIVIMDLIKSTRFVQARLARVNTGFSIIVGQLLGITYGASILIREADRGALSREDILFVGTFLMICHAIAEDVLLFALFRANWLVIVTVRLSVATLISFAMLYLYRLFVPQRPAPS